MPYLAEHGLNDLFALSFAEAFSAVLCSVGRGWRGCPAALGILQNHLQSFGFEVFTAESGEAALRLIDTLGKGTRFKLLVVDLSMPGMDGLELLAMLRSDPSTSDIPVVILSGDIQPLRSRLAEDSSLALLSKPFEQERLVSTVEKMLQEVEATKAE